jgi:hypothetical protein
LWAAAEAYIISPQLPMTPLRMLWYYLWVAPHLLQGIVAYAMFRRGLQRQFPIFLLYTGFEMLQLAVLLAISLSPLHFGEGYFHVYSVGLALSTAIRFAVIRELFGHLFERYPVITGSGRLLLRGATVVLLLLALALAVSAPGNSMEFLKHVTYALDRVVSILQAGLLVSLFLFSRYFALSWRSQAFGISLGLGILASVELAMSALRLYGLVSGTVFDFVIMASYHLCVLIWILYLALPERQARFTLNPLPEHNLDIWNRELERLLQR